MTGAPVFLICEQIKEEKKPPAAVAAAAVQPPPPLSAVPGGFLKQLVRETEKETRHKEPELKEEKTVRSHSTGWETCSRGSGGQSTQIKYLSKSTATYSKILLQ